MESGPHLLIIYFILGWQMEHDAWLYLQPLDLASDSGSATH